MVEGRSISHYDLAEKLGEGGMGVVYKAWDRELGRPVALKFLPAHLAESPGQLTRFKQEARAIAALNHPNIATIYEIDEAERQCFLALEYLPGGTLKSALEQLKAAGQTLSLEQGLEYATQIADALAHAHKHGVIHRDIKTANVLFAESGSLKITDFGLAKLAEGVDVTRTGSVLGTPATMSPEQAQGLDADERSDIFSAGVVMFELFAGELPFRGATPVSMLHQVVYASAPPLGQIRAGIPIALERIVAKALEKEREFRYQGAADLAADLRGLRRELLLSASSPERSGLETVAITPVPTRRRHGRAFGLAAACAAVGMAAWMEWPVLNDRVVRLGTSLHSRALPAEKRLAILPFRNLGGDPKDQTFVDGLREVVIGKLTSLERPRGSLVVVVSPDEVQAKEISTPAEAGKRLGATLVMTGSVIGTGQRPQLIVNLEDPQNLTMLRSETIDVSQTDLTAQAGKLVRMLEVGMNAQARQALGAGNSHDPAATRYYIEGRGYLRRSDRVEDLDLAASAFRDALAKDPNYALAWAGLAEASLQTYRIRQDPGLLAQASDQAQHALQLNGRMAAVHITMGQIRRERGQYENAVQELSTALELEPANASAFQALGTVYEAMNKYEAAETTYRKAIDMRPGDANGHKSLGVFYFHQQQLSKAALSFIRAIELTPDSYLARNNLGVVYLQMGRFTDAVEQFEKSASLEPNASAYTNLGAAYYYLGRYADAIGPDRRAVDIAPKNSVYWGNLADAYRWTPDLADQAPAAFRQAIGLVDQEIQINPHDPRLRARRAVYYVSIGDRRALAEIQEAIRLDGSQAYVQYRAALVYEQLGDREAALKALKLAIDAKQPIADILAAPPLARLRKDPRFALIAGPRP